MKSVKEATVSGVKWGAIEKISVQGIRFVLSLIMARLLAPSDYGMVSMIMIFIVLGDTLVDSGFTNALTRKKTQTEDDFSTVFYFNIAIAVVCYSLLFAISGFVADFFCMPLLKSLLRVQSLSLIINALLAVQVTKLTIDLNFKALAKCSFSASLLSGTLGIVLAYYGFGVWSLVWQTLFSCTINLMCVCWFCRWVPALRFSRESFHSMFSYGSKLLASTLINKIYQNLTTLVIGKFYSARDLGEYDRGAGLAAFPADNINVIMQKVSFPIMAKIQDDEERLINVYKKYIKMLSMVVFFACMLLAAVAKPLILILLGTKWSGAIIFLQIYIFSVCFSHIDTVNLNLLFIKKRSDLVLKLEFIKKSLSTIVLLCSIPLGVVAICISRVIYTLITIISDSYYTGKFYDYGFMKQLKDVGPFFMCSLLACAPAFAISFSALPNYVSLIIGIMVSVLLYYFMMRKNPFMVELIGLLKKLTKR